MTVSQLARKTDIGQILAALWLDHAAELCGSTLRELFLACEANHAAVYWGCWSEAELEAVIV